MGMKAALLKKIMSLFHMGLLYVDDQDYIVFADKTWEDVIGLGNNIVGEKWHKIVPWLSLEKYHLINHASFVEDIPGREDLYVECQPIYNGSKFIGTGCMLHPFEGIYCKNKILYLEDVIAELNDIMEFSYDGISVMNSEGVVMRVNSSYERVTGYKASDVLGKRARDIVKEGFLLTSCTERVLRDKKRTTIMNKTSSGKYILVTGNPIFDEDGNLKRVIANVRDIMELVELQQKLESLTTLYEREVQKRINHESSYHNFIVNSTSMKNVLELIHKIAKVESNVLITGESGVGKEIVAELIHELSGRNKEPFIKVNCSAIPDTLLESELFGYDRGAFTGALAQGKPGMFELANGGTLLLDEIGEMPGNLQAKLLRIIQNQEVVRIGGTKTIKLNIRLITATNRDLEQMAQEGSFREDLYYRLNVIPIHVPPLRERVEDIPLLINIYLDKFNKKYNKNKKISPSAIDRLMDYSWPGNVRELINIVERMVVLSDVDLITDTEIPQKVLAVVKEQGASFKDTSNKNYIKQDMEDYEKNLLRRTIEKCGSTRKAARILGIDHSTVARKIKKYGIVYKEN